MKDVADPTNGRNVEIKLKVPFWAAVRVGKMLYLSGQISIDDTGILVPGGIADEPHQVMKNIRATLERCGSSLDRAIKATVMLADMAKWVDNERSVRDLFR